jgi:hypothetical protein
VLIQGKGGIEAIISSMGEHMSNSTVQERGLAALHILRVNAFNQVTISKSVDIIIQVSLWHTAIMCT